MITLTISLRDRHRVRAGIRFDATRSLDHAAAELARVSYAGQRQTGEHVMVTVTADNLPRGQWWADHRWPHEADDAVRRARRKEPVPQ